jgi:thioredoxin reductase (NADPH)
MSDVDVAIIGAGPSGIAAAIQLKRYGFDPVVFEAERIGGLLNNAHLVENYPGFPDGISGAELVKLFARQGQNRSIKIRFEPVNSLTRHDRKFILETSAGIYHANTVVVASGTRPIMFTDIQIPEQIKNKVFYEVFDLAEVKEKNIAIIGGGDAAFDYALNLSRHNHVTIINRGSKIRALPLLLERAQANQQININLDCVLKHIQFHRPDSIELEYQGPQGEGRLLVDLIVFAVGRKPRLDFLPPRWETMEKEIDNLYFCGDVINGSYRQTAIAVGDGIKAAMEICNRPRPKEQE